MAYVDMYDSVRFLRESAMDPDAWHILREASASLLVQQRWAIPEPLKVERATSMALTLYFII